MAAIVSGVAPLQKMVKQVSDGLDGIAGLVPGSAPIVAQIKALVANFIPQALQQQMQPQPQGQISPGPAGQGPGGPAQPMPGM